MGVHDVTARVGLAALSGFVLAASFPSPRWGWLAFLGMYPLLVAVRGAPVRSRLLYGVLAGFLWAFVESRGWLFDAVRANSTFGSLGVIGIGLAACVYVSGTLLMAYALIVPWLPAPQWLSAPAAWTVLEGLRTALLNVPMNTLGHSLHATVLAQTAELTGVPGLSFLLMMPAAALVTTGTTRVVGLILAGVLVAAGLVFGASRVKVYANHPERGSLIHVVSGYNESPDPVERYAQAALPGASVTVWPEAASGWRFLEEHAAMLHRVHQTAATRGWLLLGTPRYAYDAEGVRRFYNAAMLFNPEGGLAGVYDKHYLVPGLEDSPLGARIFTTSAHPVALLQAGPVTVGPLLCWESLFAEPALTYARQGVDVLANLTGDATVGSGAVQHIAITTFRAIETRTWLVRASGIHESVVIDPAGGVRRADWVRVDRHASAPTFYARHPHAVVQVAVVLLVALSVLA